MYKVLEASFLNLNWSIEELAPACVKYGFEGIGVQPQLLENEDRAMEASALMKDLGLKWGLMPMPADMFSWNLDEERFEAALIKLAKNAALSEKMGVKRCYNHIWPSAPMGFDECFEHHVRRLKRIVEILDDHGIHYGLEFLGPHELRFLYAHPFVHTPAGVLAIADAAGGKAGLVFDTFHWFCSGNALMDDLIFAVNHPERIVAIHLNDGIKGKTFDQQRDLNRALPMTTGLVNSADVYRRFCAAGANAACMVEPFEPSKSVFASYATADEAVRAAAEAFARVEAKA